MQGRLAALLAWRPVDPARVWLWSRLAVGLPLRALAVATAQRQRIVLERAYRSFYDQAGSWRDRGATLLPVHLMETERALDRANVDAAEAEIAERRARLDALREAVRQPFAPPDDDDPALGERMLPAKPPPPPLTDLQIAQIVSAFRRDHLDDPGLRALPEQIVDALYRAAARVAGDPEPDLRLEAPLLRRRLLAALPPDGAVRAPQPDTTAPAEFASPPISRFFGAPARIAPVLRLDGADATLAPLPVDDRFYAVVVQSGMGARRILGLPAPPASLPPIEAAEEPDDDLDMPAADWMARDEPLDAFDAIDAVPVEPAGD
jgi:hypothetical protein